MFSEEGRVLKNETIEQAFTRLLEAELGMDKKSACFKGIYQHFYEDIFSEENFTTHYIVMAYEVMFTADMALLSVAQHHDYRWFSKTDLLNHNEVHMHTKWYMQSNKQADNLITAFKA